MSLSDSLPDRLRKAAEFRKYECRGRDETFRMIGEQDENSRLQKLLTPLIECVEALEQAIEVSAKYKTAGMDLFSLSGMKGAAALTAVREALDKGEG